MRGIKWWLAAGLLAAHCAARAADQGPTAEAKVDLYSANIWRGIVFGDEPVVQPCLTVTTPFALQLGTWFNMDLTDAANQRAEVTEIDLFANYPLPVPGPLAWTAGLTEYTFPYHNQNHNGIDDTAAGCLSAAWPGVWLTPAVCVTYDFQEVKGFYAQFCLNHDETIAGPWSAGAGISLAAGSAQYNEFYFGVPANKLLDLAATLRLARAFGPSVQAGLSANYTCLPDRDIRAAAGDWYVRGDQFYGGVNLKYRF